MSTCWPFSCLSSYKSIVSWHIPLISGRGKPSLHREFYLGYIVSSRPTWATVRLLWGHIMSGRQMSIIASPYPRRLLVSPSQGIWPRNSGWSRCGVCGDATGIRTTEQTECIPRQVSGLLPPPCPPANKPSAPVPH